MNTNCDSYVCRICGCCPGALDNIFTSNINGCVSATAIKDLLQTKVEEADLYPNFICKKCYRKLRDSLKFRDLFLQSKLICDNEISKRGVQNSAGDRTGSGDIGDYLQVVVKEEYINSKQDGWNNVISEENKDFENEEEIITDDYNPSEAVIDCLTIKEEINFKEEPTQIEEDGLCEENPNPRQASCAVPSTIGRHVTCNMLQLHVANNIIDKHVASRKTQEQVAINIPRDAYGETSFQDSTKGKNSEKVFASKGELIKGHESNPERKNSLCQRKSSPDKRDASEVKSYNCKMCTKSYARRTSLKKHENFIHGEIHFECKICRRKFAQRYDLRNHELRHLGEKNYACDQCDKRFVASLDLKRHQKTHNKHLSPKDVAQTTEAEKKDFKCSFCGKEFSTKSNLRNHERRHAVERRYECKTCHKAFIISRDLRVHEKRHLGDRKHACDQCNKRFLTTSELSTHKRNHNKVLRYFCDTCKRGFLYKGTLARHMMIHNNARQFTCDVCNASYSQMSNLRRHYSKHKTHQQVTVGC